MGILDTLSQVLDSGNDAYYRSIAANTKVMFPDLDEDAFVNYYKRFTNMNQIQSTMVQQQVEERLLKIRAAEKPGKACMGMCHIRDARCGECLKMQQPFVDGIELVRQIERGISDPSVLHMKKFTKCTLCSAPYESGERECPYCGTAYPADAVTIDLPTDPGELKMLSRKKAAEVWTAFPALRKMQAEMVKEDYKKSNADGDIMICYVAAMEAAAIRKTAPMTAEQLRQGAEKYDTTLVGYMYGVINGEMNSVAAEELSKQAEAANQARKQQHEANMRRIQEQHERDLERNQRRLNMIYGSGPPKYSGGGGFQRTCADCTYYSAGARKCGHSGFSTNAGDSCGYFRIK